MLKITALPTEIVRALQDGGADAHGQMPERAVSDGGGNPAAIACGTSPKARIC